MFDTIWHAPNINPVALDLGLIKIRWYALAYVVGLLIGFNMVPYMIKRKKLQWINAQQIDAMFPWVAFGILLGGRLGYVVFYQPEFYFAHPLQILAVYKGGMSFHGGLLGCSIAAYVYCRRHAMNFLRCVDLFSVVAPIGLFFGRLANFINGELWGRVTDGTWGVIFPRAGTALRYPSQLFEAFFEGFFLFALLYTLAMLFDGIKARGLCSGVFLLGYGWIRIFLENYRQPDVFLGTFVYGTTMGQWLSVPMIILGAVLVRRAVRGQ